MATPAQPAAERPAAPAAAATPFGFVGPGHELFAEIEQLRSQIAADPGLQPTGAPGEIVRRDLRVRATADGWRVARLYWSLQRSDPGTPGGLRARTLVVDRRLGETSAVAYDFPDDPRLPAAGDPAGPLLAGHGGAPVRVLRYIPLGRITFRTADGAAGRLIGKLKRGGSLGRSYALLAEVCGVVARTGASFAVAAPRGLDARRGVYFQELLPGSPLDECGDPEFAVAALRHLGAIHAELHALPVDAAAAHPAARSAELAMESTWIGVAAPHQREALERIRAWLELNLPHDASPGVYCHGDLTPAQALYDGERWSIVDLDDGYRGDRHEELAVVLCSVGHTMRAFDGPGRARLVERGRSAYLEGYAAGGACELDRGRLRAHLLRAELLLLARRLRKDRADGAEIDAFVALATSACD